MTQALIVIDVQNDFCPGGALACTRMMGVSGLAFEVWGFEAVYRLQDCRDGGRGVEHVWVLQVWVVRCTVVSAGCGIETLWGLSSL